MKKYKIVLLWSKKTIYTNDLQEHLGELRNTPFEVYEYNEDKKEYVCKGTY